MLEIAHFGKEVVGLQAADLIAREVFKFYDNAGVRPVRKPVLTLSRNVTFFCWTAEALTEFAKLKSSIGNAGALVAFAQHFTATERCTPIVPGVFTGPLAR
jgi:hypothetical protein